MAKNKYSVETLRELNVSYDHEHGLTQKKCYLCIDKRVIWKHEEHGGSEQSGIFLSVARSHASLLQIVDSQIKYFTLSQIYVKFLIFSNHPFLPVIIAFMSFSLLSAAIGVRLFMSVFRISSRTWLRTGSSSWKKLSCIPSLDCPSLSTDVLPTLPPYLRLALSA